MPDQPPAQVLTCDDQEMMRVGLRMVVESRPATRILMITTFDFDEYVFAALLHLGETTVKTHVGRILGKFEVRDRIGAVVWAYESGLRRPGEADGRPGRTARR